MLPAGSAMLGKFTVEIKRVVMISFGIWVFFRLYLSPQNPKMLVGLIYLGSNTYRILTENRTCSCSPPCTHLARDGVHVKPAKRLG